MKNIRKKECAAFMEEALQCMAQMPVEGICLLAKLENGVIFSQFCNADIMDKLLYAGVIQQSATMDTLEKNQLIKGKDCSDF